MKMKKEQAALLRVCLVLKVFFSSLWVNEAGLTTSITNSKVPCFFVFGDSMSDIGNNNDNDLILARADYRPYGIDLPLLPPTGRFTNGRNLADFVATFLGFDGYIPPFKQARRRNILNGVNYASGASGIFDESGINQGKIAGLGKQLQNHNITTGRIKRMLGRGTEKYLNKCVYMVALGANDYINNFLLPLSVRNVSSRSATPEEFAFSLTTALSRKLKILYELGARKVAVFGVGGLGCSPYAISNFPTNGAPCVGSIDNYVQLFNSGFKSLVDQLNATLPDSKFTFIDIHHISMVLPRPSDLISNAPCCEVAVGGMQCIPSGKVCANRTQYSFWDAVHLTEAAYGAIAARAFKAESSNDSYPFDIHTLSQF